MKCKDCAHVEVCAEYAEGLFNARGVTLNLEQIASLLECDDCEHFKARSQFVELPFEQNKGASPFDKVAHTTYTLATESHRVASFTIEGLMNIKADTTDNQLELTVEVADGKYKKHFIGLSDNVTYTVEDISGSEVSKYHYSINYNPKMWIPFTLKNID